MPNKFFGKKVKAEKESTDGPEVDAEVEVTGEEVPEPIDLDAEAKLPDLDLDFGGSDPEGSELVRLQKELVGAQDKHIRAVAELENVQKRNAKERRDLLKYAGEKLAFDILDSVDDLDRACSQGQEISAEELLKGISLIRDSLTAALARHGISSEESLGKTFDPNKHEALASVPTADAESGTIIEQFKRLYTFKDKLLRPAQVVVAVEPPEEES